MNRILFFTKRNDSDYYLNGYEPPVMLKIENDTWCIDRNVDRSQVQLKTFSSDLYSVGNCIASGKHRMMNKEEYVAIKADVISQYFWTTFLTIYNIVNRYGSVNIMGRLTYVNEDFLDLNIITPRFKCDTTLMANFSYPFKVTDGLCAKSQSEVRENLNINKSVPIVNNSPFCFIRNRLFNSNLMCSDGSNPQPQTQPQPPGGTSSSEYPLLVEQFVRSDDLLRQPGEINDSFGGQSIQANVNNFDESQNITINTDVPIESIQVTPSYNIINDI